MSEQAQDSRHRSRLGVGGGVAGTQGKANAKHPKTGHMGLEID